VPEVVQPIDTTAAGDSFNAAYLAARLNGENPVAAATAAHGLAGQVIRHRGAIMPRASARCIAHDPEKLPRPSGWIPVSADRANRATPDRDRGHAMTSIDPKLRKALTGISGILVTPFDRQDNLAPSRLKPIVDRAVDAGVHILVANGNTGEFYSLTTAEAEAMVHAAAELVAGRVPLLAGVGRSINDACTLARASRAAGASALMVHQPPDPFVSPRGVVTYVQRIADAAADCRSCSTCATTASVSTPSRSCARSRAWPG
jgi:hypothetical protein